MDNLNNNLNDINNENATPETENTFDTVPETTTELHIENTASVFDAEPVVENQQPSAQPQSNFAAFDSQAQTNQTYYNYQTNTVAAPQATTNNEAAEKSKTKSMVAMILGIISVVMSCGCCCLPISVVLSIVSLVLALKSKKLSPDNKFNGMAIAAIICASLGLFFYVITLLSYAIVGLAAMSDPEIKADINEILAQFGYELI